MRVRSAQLATIGKATQSTFHSRLVGHIQEFFPAHYRVIGPEQLRKVIETAESNAARFSLRSERDICLFLSLMLYLGSQFHSDPLLPWAKAALVKPDTDATHSRIDATYDTATEYLNRVAGPDGEFSIAAASRFERAGNELDRLITRPLSNALAWLHPQKFAELSREQLDALTQQSAHLASSHNLDPQRGTLLCAILKFLLGHSFDRDPQFPRVAQSLNQPSAGDPLKRTIQLRDAAATNIQRWFSDSDAT